MYKLFFGYKYSLTTGFNSEDDVSLFNTSKEVLDWITAKLIIENKKRKIIHYWVWVYNGSKLVYVNPTLDKENLLTKNVPYISEKTKKSLEEYDKIVSNRGVKKISLLKWLTNKFQKSVSSLEDSLNDIHKSLAYFSSIDKQNDFKNIK